ncbi:carboxymuconolactone decarboxylase family protein [Bradyrhizobium sp. Pha-3]|uniref:carboxymuconolactone decarboxylase family protein n=1 Tax=Bradyrhizobium sp. Pha-3 TaxID=208375 RepID=UPI0035D4E14B
MSIDELKGRIPDFAKDVRLNLSSMVLDESLGEQTRYGLFLACAVATRNSRVMSAFEALAVEKMTPAAVAAAKAVATVMAMNNIYYRFVHLTSNKEYGDMPSRLRMNVIGGPGVDKADFELWSLAVSAINGCGACIDSHEKVLQDTSVAATTIQTAVRFAAIMQSVAVAIEAGNATMSVA